LSNPPNFFVNLNFDTLCENNMPCEVILLQLEVHFHKLSWSVFNALHIKLNIDMYTVNCLNLAYVNTVYVG
jgi:hypothetical protein